MSPEKALVKNAADAEQVAKGKSKEDARRFEELNDLRGILATPGGRRFMWRMLGKCRVFESIYHASALIHYNSGQQDIGHFVMAEIVDARADALLEMMQESKQAEEKDNA